MIKAISIFGLGYVGLCTSACFADKGFRVIGVDVDEEKIKYLARGKSTIYESNLEPMLKRAIEKGTFLPTTDAKSAVNESTISFITVGTPSKNDGNIDLRYVESAVQDVGLAMKD